METRPIISQQDQVNQILSQQQKRDEAINTLLDRLVEILDKIDPLEASKSDFNQVLQVEYLIVKLRALVTQELALTKQVIANATKVSPSILSLFKQRDVYLVSILQRCNEFREDSNTIQKLVYTTQIPTIYK